MGASYWSYLVPHDDLVERAFATLQAEVRREHHGDEPGSAEGGTHSILDMVRVVDAPAPPKPSPEELGQRLLAALLGTPDTTQGTIFRMTDDELLACVGTSHPTREPAVRKLSIERGTGRWTPIYEDGKTVSLWFGGLSGD